MANNLTLNNPEQITATMSSREIAELTGSWHFNVLATVRNLAERGVISGNETPYTHPQNGQTYTEFLLSYRDTMVVVSGYSVELRARIIDRWQELESKHQKPSELSRMDILKLAMESEEARLKAEAERDHAIATKAQIGSRREATAMASASSARREVARLREELGVNQRHATIIAVENATKTKFGAQFWRRLKDWCDQRGVIPSTATDPRWGTVKAWPADAWMAVAGVDLSRLFPGQDGFTQAELAG